MGKRRGGKGRGESPRDTSTSRGRGRGSPQPPAHFASGRGMSHTHNRRGDKEIQTVRSSPYSTGSPMRFAHSNFRQKPPGLPLPSELQTSEFSKHIFIARFGSKHALTLDIVMKDSGLGDKELSVFATWFKSWLATVVVFAQQHAKKSVRLRVALQQNSISDVGVTDLMDALVAHCPFVQVRKLWLYKNRIGDIGARAVAQLFMKSNGTLEEVHLSHNCITFAGAKELIDAVRACKMYPRSANSTSAVEMQSSTTADAPHNVRVDSAITQLNSLHIDTSGITSLNGLSLSR